MRIFVRLMSSFALLIIFTLFSYTSTLASQEYDLNIASKWNIRIDGPSADAGGSSANIYKDVSADINNNGKADLIICYTLANNQSRSHSGSCYVLYDSLIESYQGTGNTIDLADTSKFNIRFDGPSVDAFLGYTSGAAVVDLNQNNRNDILLPASGATYGGNNSGSFYIIYDDLLSGYSSTGNIVDLSDSNKWSIRYDGDIGSSNNHALSEGYLRGIDVNNNDIPDIVVASGHSGTGAGSRNGELTIIYDSYINTNPGYGLVVNLTDDTKYNLRFYEANLSYFGNLTAVEIVDINNNGKVDIVVDAGSADKNSRTDSGSVFVIYDSIIELYSGTGNLIDLTNTNNFNIRIDGPCASCMLGFNSLATSDINSNSRPDLIIGTYSTGYNSRSYSGSVYILYDSYLDTLTGVGNTLDLSDTSKFSVRVDGPASSTYFGYALNDMYDFDNNGTVDLSFLVPYQSNNGRANSGSSYIIYNEQFGSFSGTGNLVDMASQPYSVRYDGATAGVAFATFFYQGDINNDSSVDLMYLNTWADPNGRNNSGSTYIIYNFPHTISMTSDSRDGSRLVIRGSVNAQNSVTPISGVQYKIGNNDPGSGWTECTADDGSFNSNNESYTCTNLSAPTTDGQNVTYIRAYDSNTSYTSRSNYSSHIYTIGSQTLDTSPHQIPFFEGKRTTFQVVSPYVDSYTSGQEVIAIVKPNTFSGMDSYFSVKTDLVNTKKIYIKNIRYRPIGYIQNIWYKAYPPDNLHEAARILPTLQYQPSILSLSYANDNSNSFNVNKLRIAHSSDGINWKLIPNSIVDKQNKTISFINKIGGFYTIVYPY